MPRTNPRRDVRSTLPSGYEGQNVPLEKIIPPNGIEDVDKAVFNLFDKVLSFPSKNNKSSRILVIFATGERFALVKNRKPIRDKGGAFILPLIAVRRSGINLLPDVSYGLPTDTGDLVIKKRLAETDSDYQNFINKLGLVNQTNVKSLNNFQDRTNKLTALPGTKTSRRISDKRDVKFLSGHLLKNDVQRNIFEVITIPFPKFFKASYEVTFWSQYQVQMNQMIENMVMSVETNGYNFKVQSDKGYWYVAELGDDFRSGDNFEEFVDQERMIRYTFTINVNSWFVASQNPGMPSPFRRYFSAPQINFSVDQISAPISSPYKRDTEAISGNPNDFILDEIEDLDQRGKEVIPEGFEMDQVFETVKDPFSGKEEGEYLQVINRNQRTGETVVSTRVVKRIDEFSS